MIRLMGERIYLATLEKEHCKLLWEATEYDFSAMTEPLVIGLSSEKADAWFEDIQRDQGVKHVRLGIFLRDDTVIGDIALQDIDWKNRSCTIGLGVARMEHRNKGYGTEAVSLMLAHGFRNMGLERIAANTLACNVAAQRSLERAGFVLEGRERNAIYFAAQKWDRLTYGMLMEEFIHRHP